MEKVSKIGWYNKSRLGEHMIETNKEIIGFLINNIVLILLLIISILRIVPPDWAGFWKFNNNKEADGIAPRITVVNFILTSLFDSIIRAFFIPLIATFGLKNMVTLIIFLVVAFDIFFRNEITTQSVTLIAIGIVALYLDKLVETGKRITLFGGLLRWEKDKD